MKLLLIRGKHDYFTYKAFDAAELVKTHELDQNWNVIDKAGKDANKQDVLAAFDGTVDLVIHYSHGGKAELFGQKKNGNKKSADSRRVEIEIKGRSPLFKHGHEGTKSVPDWRPACPCRTG